MLEKKKSSYKHGGIHGVCLLVKNEFANYVQEIRDTTSDAILWTKVAKAAFGFEFILGTVYVPHEGSIFFNKDYFGNVSQDISFINSKYSLPIVMLGDFNSRTGTLSDS